MPLRLTRQWVKSGNFRTGLVSDWQPSLLVFLTSDIRMANQSQPLKLGRPVT
jgi:hypothetical protein